MDAQNRPTVLITDDEQDFRTIFSEKLKQSGFNITTANSGNEAIEKAKKAPPDLILMDIRMPGGPSGIDTALAMKNNPATKDIKIVFLSSLDDPWPGMSGSKGDVSREFGMEDFFSKADDLDKLVEKINAILRQK